MVRLTEILSDAPEGRESDGLTLDFDRRRKSRQRVVLDSGVEAGLFLPRGTVLREGDRLRGDDGSVVRVKAAPETLSVVAAQDRLQLARAAYHLGNRHLPVEITAMGLQYQHDHVLDTMVRGLGLEVTVCEGPFNPEGGAYGGGHGHGHDHDHDHDHDHGGSLLLLHDHDHS
ncbi:MAG TPA: urease accessory protein UreE [Polyangia bacterium]